MNLCQWIKLTIPQILSNIAELYRITIKNPTNNINYRINNNDTCLTYYPISVRNKTDNVRKYRYTINLPQPITSSPYVFTVRADCEFDEFLLSGMTPPITGDIYDANGYFFRSHFTLDTTWTPPMLPLTPYTPAIYNCKSSQPNSQTVFTIQYVDPTKYYIDIDLQPQTYVTGTLNLGYSEIFPTSLENLKTFKFTIVRTLITP